jgi:hypothetical protein
MKKLSFSLVALLALVFAVASAFTTKHVNLKTVSTTEWFANSSLSATASVQQDFSSQLDVLPGTSTTAAVDAYAAIHCTRSSLICIAKVNLKDNVQDPAKRNLAPIDTRTGDFQP